MRTCWNHIHPDCYEVTFSIGEHGSPNRVPPCWVSHQISESASISYNPSSKPDKFYSDTSHPGLDKLGVLSLTHFLKSYPSLASAWSCYTAFRMECLAEVWESMNSTHSLFQRRRRVDYSLWHWPTFMHPAFHMRGECASQASMSVGHKGKTLMIACVCVCMQRGIMCQLIRKLHGLFLKAKSWCKNINSLRYQIMWRKHTKVRGCLGFLLF